MPSAQSITERPPHNRPMGKSTEMPQPNSPNGCFERHGYTVVRTPRKSGVGSHRAIYDQRCQQILNRAGYDAEMQFCRDQGLLEADGIGK